MLKSAAERNVPSSTDPRARRQAHTLGPVLSPVMGASLVLAVAAAACGDGAHGPSPQVPSTPAPTTAPGAPTPGASTAEPSAPGATTPPAPPSGPMKAIAASAMAEDLKKLGIDPTKPQPLSKLSPDTIRKLMPSFAKSLGVKCDFCHDTNNFKAWTSHKNVAANMWQSFVVNLAMEDGTPLYCDSCHGGHPEFLDRHDKKALGAWMDANYVSKLKRADGKDHSCDTCHGDPFEPKFLNAWEKKH